LLLLLLLLVLLLLLLLLLVLLPAPLRHCPPTSRRESVSLQVLLLCTVVQRASRSGYYCWTRRTVTN
jgi:hypothetical protein